MVQGFLRSHPVFFLCPQSYGPVILWCRPSRPFVLSSGVLYKYDHVLFGNYKIISTSLDIVISSTVFFFSRSVLPRDTITMLYKSCQAWQAITWTCSHLGPCCAVGGCELPPPPPNTWPQSPFKNPFRAHLFSLSCTLATISELCYYCHCYCYIYLFFLMRLFSILFFASVCLAVSSAVTTRQFFLVLKLQFLLFLLAVSSTTATSKVF